MKHVALLLSTALTLSACATAPRPEPKAPTDCPRLPMLELDAPDRDWQGEMRSFLQGTLPTPPDYRLHSEPVRLPTTRPGAN